MIKREKSNLIFYKLYIKSYLLKQVIPNELCLIELIRDEVKIIVFTNVIRQFYLISRILEDFGASNFQIEQNLDLIFKLLLLSSRNKILKKLNFSYYKKGTPYLKLKQNWIIDLLDSEDYDILRTILENLVILKDKKISYVYLRLLIEHLVIKISNLVICDIFLLKKLSSPILYTCSTDCLAFLAYTNALYSYIKIRIYFNSFIIMDRIKSSFGDFFTITRTGVTLRSIVIDNLYLNVDTTFAKVIIIRSLRLFYKFLLFLIYRFTRN